MTLPHSTRAPGSGAGGVWHATRGFAEALRNRLKQMRNGGGSLFAAQTEPGAARRPVERGGLFRKYAALLVALVGGALIVSSAIEMYYSYGESRQALIAVQREKAQGAAAVIEQFVKEIEGQVDWATGFLPAGGDLEQRRFDLHRLLRQAPAITEVSYLDAEGREQIKVSRLAMDTLAGGTDMSGEPKFTQARANKRYLSPVYFRKESEPYITMARAGPGRTTGVTVAEVNLKFILDVISLIRVGKAGVAYVVDERGLLIAHPDIGVVLRKTDLSRLTHVASALRRLRDPNIEVPAVSRDRLGRDVLTASTPIRNLGWVVFVDLPLSEALQPVYAVLYRTILVLACGLLFAVLAGVWFARRMVVPIQALAMGAARIGGGDLDHRIDIRSGDEVQGLADSFNEMGGRLKESYATLEQKVEQRTRELSELLQQQTATADVLKVISRSTFDLQTVLDTLVQSAADLCGADQAVIRRRIGDDYPVAATYGFTTEQRKHIENYGSKPDRGSIFGRALIEGQVIHIPDVFADPEFGRPAAPNAIGVRAGIGVPLMREGMVVGVLSLLNHQPRSFNPKQIELLELFADQAVIAIENTRLFEEVQTRTADLQESLEYQTATGEVLNVISRSKFDLQPVLDSIVETAARLCASDMATIRRREGDVYVQLASHGLSTDYSDFSRNANWHHAGRGSLVGRVLRAGKAVEIRGRARRPRVCSERSPAPRRLPQHARSAVSEGGCANRHHRAHAPERPSVYCQASRARRNVRGPGRHCHRECATLRGGADAHGGT